MTARNASSSNIGKPEERIRCVPSSSPFDKTVNSRISLPSKPLRRADSGYFHTSSMSLFMLEKYSIN